MNFNSALYDGVLPPESTKQELSTDKFIELIERKGFDTTELAPILKGDQRISIQATAGAGKTTTLSFLLLHDLLVADYGKTFGLVSTFLRSGALAFKGTLNKTRSQLNLPMPTVGTFSFKNIHAEFLKLLQKDLALISKDPVHKNYREVAEPQQLRSIYKKIIANNQLTQYYNFPTNEQINELASFLDFRRQFVESEPPFVEFEFLELFTPNKFEKVESEFAKLKSQRRLIDFTDIIIYIYKICVNPETRLEDRYELYRHRYNYIMLDEFQDISELQYLTLKPLLETAERVVIVGDVDQSIYSFQGANPTVMQRAISELNLKSMPLSRSWRCPSNIFEPMATLIKNNSSRIPNDITAAKDGGELYHLAYNNRDNIDKKVDKIIGETVKEDKTVAIITRTNDSMLAPIVKHAIQHGGDFNVYGNPRDITTSVFEDIFRIFDLTKPNTGDIQRDLKVLDPTTSALRFKTVAEDFKSNARPIAPIDALHYIVTTTNKKNSPLIQLAKAIKGDQKPFEKYKYMLRYLKVFGASKHGFAVRVLEPILNISTSYLDFKKKTEVINDIIQDAIGDEEHLLTFATVHGFKGKEADTTVVYNASIGHFPTVSAEVFEHEMLEEEKEEERSIFFVAGTRAKEKNYYLSIYQQASPFLDEAMLPAVYDQEQNVVELNKEIKTIFDDKTTTENTDSSVSDDDIDDLLDEYV